MIIPIDTLESIMETCPLHTAWSHEEGSSCSCCVLKGPKQNQNRQFHVFPHYRDSKNTIYAHNKQQYGQPVKWLTTWHLLKKQLHRDVLWGGPAAMHGWMWIAHTHHGEEEEGEHERILVEKIELECAREWEISLLHYLWYISQITLETSI